MDLYLPLSDIKGIGPKTSAALAAAGLHTFRDLLYYLPRTYENYQGVSQIADLEPGKVIIKATVEDIKSFRKRRNLTIIEATLRDKSGAVRAVWFNQAYRLHQFYKGKEYYFSGNFGLSSSGRYQITGATNVSVDDYDKNSDKYQPIYASRGALNSKKLVQIFKTLRPSFSTIPDMLPNHPGRADALFKAHFPDNEEDVKKGRAYLAHEELFGLILASALNREANAKLKAPAIAPNLTVLKKAIASLPFTPTDAQRRALWEIIQDLERTIPMSRLLQGDVGSGKTLVAGLAALIVAVAGKQAAILAPTEILAIQHANTLYKILSPLGVRIALLTGSTKKKADLKKHIKAGDVDLIVGTHAIITDDTHFHSLAFAVIDEQHRFGVRQRQALLSKVGDLSEDGMPTGSPHLLSMTATPIPRSLQLTIFGDLSVSILNELPKGRQPITTHIVSPNSLDTMWGAIEKEVEKGHQCFYVCKQIDEHGKQTPAVEDLDSIPDEKPTKKGSSGMFRSKDVTNVKKETQKLRARFPNLKIEYLHGRMKPAEKDALMSSFAAGNIHILVSTTVIEVGVDVPNATAIAIADADTYGLAQLHQLRGRVGRGQHPAYCYLINSVSDRPTRRLKEIEGSTDGFYLAEADLKIRGPGAIYGTLQHGVLDLRIATITDTAAIKRAQKAVDAFLQKKPNLLDYKELSEGVQKYQKLTTLN